MVQIDLEGVFFGTRIAADYMMRQKSGVIINASSFAALIPHANGAVYAVAKAGVSSLTKTSGASLAPYGIRVLGYIPGMIVTDIREHFVSEYHDKFVKDIPAGRLGTPEDLAKPVVFLTSDAARYITACDIEITGGKFAVQDVSMPWKNAGILMNVSQQDAFTNRGKRNDTGRKNSPDYRSRKRNWQGCGRKISFRGCDSGTCRKDNGNTESCRKGNLRIRRKSGQLYLRCAQLGVGADACKDGDRKIWND